MKIKYFYLALIFVSLILTSAIIQSSIHKPSGTLKMASNYSEATVEFCVTAVQGNRFAISVNAGELPGGSTGLVSSTAFTLHQGDCSTSRIRIKPATEPSRYGFFGNIVELTSDSIPNPELQSVLEIRKFMGGQKGDARNLVTGLSIGDDSGLSTVLVENMKATGLTHLTAVSGANCAIVLGLVWLALRGAKLGRGLRTSIALLTLSGYVSLVGSQPSVMRSAFMMSVVFISLELGRRVWLPAALFLGSGLLLIVDPWMMFEYGFWLSVLATFGLVTLTPQLFTRFETVMPKWLAMGLSATLAAQLWCLPLLVQLQGGFTTHSILANLLVEPMVPIITVLGLLAAITGVIFPFVGNLFLTLASYPSGWIVFVANSLSTAPIHLIPLGNSWWQLGMLALFVVSISIFLVRKKFLAFASSAVLFLVWLFSGVTTAVNTVTWSRFEWSVVACDVGQGDALVVKSANQIAVIDVGRENQKIDDCLDSLGVQEIDLLVLTHFDMDHVGGATGLLRGRTVSKVLLSQFPDERPQAKYLVDQLENSINEVVFAPKHLTGKLGDMTWEVISSEGDLADSANEASLGMRFESSSMVLFTLADLNRAAQERIESQVFQSEKPTVVKVSHHGSADQSPKFYDRISADVALISVGAGNSYGHPTSRTLDFLKAEGCRIFRTDLNGSISVGLDNGVIKVKTASGK